MPMESGLKLMAVIGSYGVDAEGKSLDDMVDELDSCLLVVALVDFQGSDTCRIIDSGILVPFHSSSLSIFQLQELHIHLNVVSGNHFGIPLGMQSTLGSCLG